MPRLRLADGNYLSYEAVDLTDPWEEADTIIFHHGLGKSAAYWTPWMRRLAQRFRLVALDSLGNGQSSRPRKYPWSIERYAEHVRELARHLDLVTFHLIGEGLGGCVGLHLAASAPELVKTLTLSSTPYRPAEGSGRLDMVSKGLKGRGLATWVDASLPDRMDWSQFPPKMYEWYRAKRLSVSPRILAEQMAAQATVDLEWALPRVQCPTLLIVPGKSHVNAHEQMLRMGDVIPASRVVQFPDEGQWVTFARPAECAEAFLSFVADYSIGNAAK